MCFSILNHFALEATERTAWGNYSSFFNSTGEIVGTYNKEEMSKRLYMH